MCSSHVEKLEFIVVSGNPIEGNPFEKGFSLKLPSENFTLFLWIGAVAPIHKNGIKGENFPQKVFSQQVSPDTATTSDLPHFHYTTQPQPSQSATKITDTAPSAPAFLWRNAEFSQKPCNLHSLGV